MNMYKHKCIWLWQYIVVLYTGGHLWSSCAVPTSTCLQKINATIFHIQFSEFEYRCNNWVWQVSQTLTGRAEEGKGMVLSLQLWQNMFPQCRQWCLRRDMLNSFSQRRQWEASLSGAHWASRNDLLTSRRSAILSFDSDKWAPSSSSVLSWFSTVDISWMCAPFRTSYSW